MHWKQVIEEMIQPKEKLGSVIDTFMTFGEIFEARERLEKSQGSTKENANEIMMKGLYVLGFYPFHQAHGSVLRPILLRALASDDPIKEFFIDAIPTALTIAMPPKQAEYMSIRETVKEKFNK